MSDKWTDSRGEVHNYKNAPVTEPSGDLRERLAKLREGWREIAKTLRNGYQLERGSKGATARESARVREACADELDAAVALLTPEQPSKVGERGKFQEGCIKMIERGMGVSTKGIGFTLTGAIYDDLVRPIRAAATPEPAAPRTFTEVPISEAQAVYCLSCRKVLDGDGKKPLHELKADHNHTTHRSDQCIYVALRSTPPAPEARAMAARRTLAEKANDPVSAFEKGYPHDGTPTRLAVEADELVRECATKCYADGLPRNPHKIQADILDLLGRHTLQATKEKTDGK